MHTVAFLYTVGIYKSKHDQHITKKKPEKQNKTKTENEKAKKKIIKTKQNRQIKQKN